MTPSTTSHEGKDLTSWWPVNFYWGASFNGPAEWNFGGGTIINYVRGVYGVSLGTRFIGVLSTSFGPRPYRFVSKP